MKEYRVICDIQHTSAKGEKHFHEGVTPFGQNGIGHQRILKTKEEARDYMARCIENGKIFIRKEDEMRKHYPDLIDTYEFSNYRIQCREVTEWK